MISLILFRHGLPAKRWWSDVAIVSALATLALAKPRHLAHILNSQGRLRRRSAWVAMATAGVAIACGLGLNYSDPLQRAFMAETQARAVETSALSIVAGSVPGRGAARKAQASAVMEARRMGLDVAIASVGSGGKYAADSVADRQAFTRLAQRFSNTLEVIADGNPFRERLSKTWLSGAQALAEDTAPIGISRIISEANGQGGACVVEMRASGESLRAMLLMAYDESDIAAIEDKARSLGISAADVAFLVSAHESAHCVIGMARRAELFDTSWADPQWKVPTSWDQDRSEDDHDSPALAKAEESAADMLAVLWAADALGARKARLLGNLAIYARSRGANSTYNDGLHDSSRVLERVLAPRDSDHYFSIDNRARLAWNTATFETQSEVFEMAAR